MKDLKLVTLPNGTQTVQWQGVGQPTLEQIKELQRKSMSENRIVCTYYTPSKNPESNIEGICGFHIKSMDFYLSKARLVRKKSGDLFLTSPCEVYKDATGGNKYANYWWFNKTNDFFQQEAKKAIIAYCETKSIPNPWDSFERGEYRQASEGGHETVEEDVQCPF